MRKQLAAALLAVVALSGSAKVNAETPVPPEPKVKVGEVAPDFTLKDQSRKDVKLSDFRGKKNVVLAFFVFAFTGG